MILAFVLSIAVKAITRGVEAKQILKEENINKILKDFFDEILNNLLKILDDFKKTNDEKYLTEIKNITGNSLSDDELSNLALKKNDEFSKSLKDLFFNKQKSRIDLIGEEQNKDLEKKIFLQIIDFSWR